MFIITKTFTDDEGHLYTKVNPKQYAEKELAYLNANMNTMTFSEQRQRENKKNATVFGIA